MRYKRIWIKLCLITVLILMFLNILIITYMNNSTLSFIIFAINCLLVGIVIAYIDVLNKSEKQAYRLVKHMNKEQKEKKKNNK